MPKKPRLTDFVEAELEELRSKCNFTEDELKFFNLRAKGKGLVEIMNILHYSESKVNRLSAKARSKISKVL